ncbi:uncharacterized protein LOC133383916 [Rhineura floridana]|uniref:uncharacterized protein LOC133383916 n=1 Tax=Rhineura floridana TaxID=261503 RepID=UPI002AC7E857|nr:uncharacterized protein LOC133383916 [Rhineura floridana]
MGKWVAPPTSEYGTLTYTTSDHWFIWLSIVYTNWQRLSGFLRRSLSQPYLEMLETEPRTLCIQGFPDDTHSPVAFSCIIQPLNHMLSPRTSIFSSHCLGTAHISKEGKIQSFDAIKIKPSLKIYNKVKVLSKDPGLQKNALCDQAACRHLFQLLWCPTTAPPLPSGRLTGRAQQDRTQGAFQAPCPQTWCLVCSVLECRPMGEKCSCIPRVSELGQLNNKRIWQFHRNPAENFSGNEIARTSTSSNITCIKNRILTYFA